jgi:uncharacterized protein YjbJ (UPF0337 family)
MKGNRMGIFQKLMHKAETAKGGAKKSAGHATGSRKLRAEGRSDQAKGNLKQAGENVKNAVKK